MTVVTPTDRPKSVGNRCVIEVLVALFMFSRGFFGFFCWCRGFCHRTESDLFFFLLNRFNHTRGMAIVTPTDRPKSVRYRCVIEFLVA